VSEPAGISGDVQELVNAYLRTAERWDAVQSDAAVANRVFEENHAIFKRLRASDEGRAEIVGLMAHPTTGVRLLAASHSLSWAPNEAVPVLEAIQSEGGSMP
jgi:Domain of unknown function (DUF2019)